MFDLLSVTAENFTEHALSLFRYQALHVPIYKEFIQMQRIDVSCIHTLEEIPFLPIQFFKNFDVIAEDKQAEIVFTSSGTKGTVSKHLIADLQLYELSFLESFKLFYHSPKDYVILALLPSYLERKGSSLIYMMQKLIDKSENVKSGFFLNQHELIMNTIIENEAKGIKSLLIGVSYALLDLAEHRQMNAPLHNTIIMETGGMKGRRREMVREELHQTLCNAFGVASIHSEYGMTELLSQAYSKENGIFQCPPWMRVGISDVNDPCDIHFKNKSGRINIIDLANQYSCAFIATDDIGSVDEFGCFKVLGRADNAEVRGCNLMLY